MTVRSENTISKKDIVNGIKLDVGTSSKNIHKITDEIIDIISEILKNEKKITLKNLGTFHLRHKKERYGRNPKSKEKYLISSRNTVNFRISNSLKKKLNNV